MTTKTTKKPARKRAAKRTPKRSPKRAKAAPKAKAPAKPKRAPPTDAAAMAAPKETAPRPRDPRLPKPGGILRREYQGKQIEVTVLEHGFRCDGKTWRSLSAIAKEVSGTSWNGFLFFSLQTRAKAPAQNGEKAGAQ